MFRKFRLSAITLFIALPAVLFLSAGTSAIGCVGGHGSDFVQRQGSQLTLHGKQFRFAGTNNYYLDYSPNVMTNAVLDKAAANGFNVVRTWAWMDIGNQDGTNSVWGADKGVYFQYWDGTKPAYNDGANGLQRLDYVVAAAKARGLKLVLPLTNNWSDFGGMDQYVRWAGATYHSDFYTNPKIRQWYKAWINHLLNRTNSITGIKYKDDPTIMTWELGNEPRCKGSGVYPADPNCNTTTITKWAAEMSAYIKSIDRNHLVSSGSEGFLCEPNKPGASGDWTRDCSTGEGVDELAISKLPTIDVMSYHLYPNSWGKSTDASWSTNWIKEHIKLAHSIHKPSMLGEYGWSDKATRNPVYKSWTDTVYRYGGTGALYWILSDIQDSGPALYPDYDGYTVYCPSPVCTTIANFGKMMSSRRPLTFPPVADNDTLTTEYQTAGTVDLTANDIAYPPKSQINPATVDLDPSTPGQQASGSIDAGTYSVDANGVLTFTPAVGFNGKRTLTYTVKDKVGRLSNVADVNITVKPNPHGSQMLFDFESGTEGWGPFTSGDTGTVSQTATHSEGSYGLDVNSTGGYWFGAIFASPIDMSSRTQLSVDLLSSSGTNATLVLQLGDSWDWCQESIPGWFTAPTTWNFDLTSLSSSCIGELNKVQSMGLSFNGGGDSVIDNIRVS
jgi:mannan endo-1,4-beta-mannosidase